MPYKDPEKAKAAKKKYDEKRAGRTRNFATVVYPESAPDDWIDILSEYHVATLISPLHDRDIDPNGNLKKPHYHVLLIFEGPKDFNNQVKPIFDSIGAVGRELVNSVRGYARYLCHLDNPEKHQYDVNDVRQLGGADYLAITQLPTDDIKMLMDIFAYVREHNIYSLADLLDLCAIHRPEWFSLIALSRGYIVDKYLKSITWERDTGYQRVSECSCNVVDPETGEIV